VSTSKIAPYIRSSVSAKCFLHFLYQNHTAFNHTGHVLKVHIDWVKTQVVAGINYLLRFTVVAKHLKRSYEAEVYKASFSYTLIVHKLICARTDTWVLSTQWEKE
jgi:hypothetical protein